jgi:hypothetical protein
LRLALPLVALLGGIVLTALAFRVGGDMRASRDWPSTSGTIEAARVAMQSEGNERKLFGAQVSYRYTVGGRSYTGERISFESGASPNRGLAEAIVQRYAPGSAVRVFYDPVRPERAVLEPGGTRILPWLLGGFGAALTLTGVLALLRQLR